MLQKKRTFNYGGENANVTFLPAMACTDHSVDCVVTGCDRHDGPLHRIACADPRTRGVDLGETVDHQYVPSGGCRIAAGGRHLG
ncbi:hypothetical protein D3C78_1481790 [compost metagenome]